MTLRMRVTPDVQTCGSGSQNVYDVNKPVATAMEMTAYYRVSLLIFLCLGAFVVGVQVHAVLPTLM